MVAIFFLVYIYLLGLRVNNASKDEIKYFKESIDYAESGEIQLSMDNGDIGIYTALSSNFTDIQYDEDVQRYITITYF